MSPLEISVACAPPPSMSEPHPAAPRVLGSQDTAPRSLFGSGDLLMVSDGTASGLQLGQRFFVRRANRFGAAYGRNAIGIRTLGWIRIVSLNESTAIASIEHLCDGIVAQDYLEPFVRPVVPVAAALDDTPGEPDFSALAQIVAGDEDRRTGGAGDFMLIDWGADHGVTPGTRLAIYRDVRTPGLPLASVGDAVVISVGPMLSLTRITRARDAVQSGDYVAIRK